MAGGGFQAYGGAIADVSNEESAFSHHDALVEFFGGQTWADPAEDEWRMASARAFGAALAPFSSGVYVNVLFDQSPSEIRAPTEKRSWPGWRAQASLGPRQRVPPEPEHRSSSGIHQNQAGVGSGSARR